VSNGGIAGPRVVSGGVEVSSRAAEICVAVLPAHLEAGDDAVDHDGGDVAVDAAYSLSAVSESAALDYFGDIIFDEPDFVGVAGVVV
jgi:hypothetical protein